MKHFIFVWNLSIQRFWLMDKLDLKKLYSEIAIEVPLSQFVMIQGEIWAWEFS